MKKIITLTLFIPLIFLGGFAKVETTEFIQENNTVHVTVYRGSSRVTHELLDYSIKDGVLTMNVKRHSPMVQTMDYVPHVISVVLDKKEHVKMVHVNTVLKGRAE